MSFIKANNSLKPIEVDMLSFSGKVSIPDQILSIFSFLYYVGLPTKWTIYTDKTYTEEDKKTLLSLFPFCEILDWDNSEPIDNVIYDCNNKYFLAKKLNAIINHPKKGITIYADSDIIFYSKFKKYITSPLIKPDNWFMADTLSDDDSKWFTENAFTRLNSGFFLFNTDFDNNDLIIFLKSLNGDFNAYFTEQLAFEYAFQKQNAKSLDARTFILDTGDQFSFDTPYLPSHIALRHYTSPVRHKMWQYGWRWHFN
ncbi:hypothetical protein [Parasediminibacterium sp. JCM 36343]|uniref:hypothetical protein n=1 Tax=Parasediminibacterium sp. JCM 36343 TaxID=3374279 RepID=UPI00397974CF